MNKEMYLYSLIFVLSFSLSCATTNKERYMNKLSPKEEAYLKVTTVKIKANQKIAGKRLGLLPLNCNKPEVGNVISDTIGHNLLDSSLIIVERTYLVKIIEEQGISLTGLTENIDYSKIGKVSNVDYIMVGTVTMVDRQYSWGFGYGFKKEGSYTECSGAAARIVDLISGEVVMSVVYDTTLVEAKWKQPTQIGEALATGIKYGLWQQGQPKPTQ